MGVDGAANTRRIDEESDPVRVEIEYVISRNIPIIPVLFDGMTMESLKSLPESIATFVYRNGFEIRADPYFRSDMEMVVRRIKTDFPSEADREQQALQERLAQLERERKLTEDRRRLGELEADRLRREEQERLAQVQAEEERKRQEALEKQRQLEAAYKEKLAAIKKQRDTVEILVMVVVIALGTALGGYTGHTLWSNLLGSGGGTIVAVIIIGVLALVGLFVGLFIGVGLGYAVTGGLKAAIVVTLGTIAGAILGASKGASTNGGVANTLIGLGLGTLIFGALFGFVGAIIRDEHASPWYVGTASRISIPKGERVKLPPATKTPSNQAGTASR